MRIALLMAVDEIYVAPLRVTVATLLECLRADVDIDLYLMGRDLTPATRSDLDDAWGARVRVHWLSLDPCKDAILRGFGRASPDAARLRLLLGSSLPDAVSKVIYLDADLLVRKDLFALWQQPMHGNIVLAVQDSYQQRPPLHCLPVSRRIARELPYFNSGVMLIDVAAWRAAGVERACLEVGARLARASRWIDQDVLNLCLAGRWGALPPVWNKQYSLDLFPDWRCSPYTEREFRDARGDPAIVHFCTRTKPWHAYCDHAPQDVQAFRVALRQCCGNVLAETPRLRKRVGEFFGAPHRRLLDVAAAAVHARRRRHAILAMLPEMVRVALLHPWTLVSVPLSVLRERIALRVAA
jgi:lipopolysaccharide biosynthesis glycosyltransferase